MIAAPHKTYDGGRCTWNPKNGQPIDIYPRLPHNFGNVAGNITGNITENPQVPEKPFFIATSGSATVRAMPSGGAYRPIRATARRLS
jgi:hypothetical protein